MDRDESRNGDREPTAEELEIDRRLAEALRREHEEFMEFVRNHDRRIEEIESRKGILERWFGISTQVP